MKTMTWAAATALALASLTPAGAQQPAKVKMAIVPSVPSASTYIALDKGYFRDAGLEVTIETINTLGKAVPFLATNQVQVAQGGINAGTFNSVAQGLPIVLTLEGGSTPLYHEVLIRPGLAGKIKKPADLKGHTVAVNSNGSVLMYELNAVLKAGGLTTKDITLKYISFPQMGAALANGALDAAVEVAPFTDRIKAQKIAVPFVDPEKYVTPLPLTNVGYVASGDWLKKDHDVAKRLFLALAKAGRDYCQAYHHGPNRQEVIDILMKHGVVKDAKLLDKMGWQARTPNGRFNLASLQSIQDFFKAQGVIEKEAPIDKMVDFEFSDNAAKTLGPFKVINTSDKLAGCR